MSPGFEELLLLFRSCRGLLEDPRLDEPVGELDLLRGLGSIIIVFTSLAMFSLSRFILTLGLDSCFLDNKFSVSEGELLLDPFWYSLLPFIIWFDEMIASEADGLVRGVGGVTEIKVEGNRSWSDSSYSISSVYSQYIVQVSLIQHNKDQYIHVQCTAKYRQ